MNGDQQGRAFILTQSLEHMSLPEVRSAVEALRCDYGVWQLELGEETGYPHWQIYISFSSPRRFRTIKDHFPTAHIERRRGSHAQARDYCSKEDTRIDGPWEHGEYHEQQPGRRSDVQELHQSVLDGRTMRELWFEKPAMLRLYRGVQAMVAAIGQPYAGVRRVFVLHGAPGTGKSLRCSIIAPNAYRVTAPATAGQPVWWDGYSGEEAVIFDDFYGWYKFAALLVLIDQYPTRVQYRGGSCPFNGKLILFTSNLPPERWYPNVGELRLEALRRRIEGVIEVSGLTQILEAPFDFALRITQ